MSSDRIRNMSAVLNRLVRDSMHKDPLRLSSSMNTRDAAKQLHSGGKDDIIVVDGQDLVGIVTDEDILSKVSDASVNAEETTLRDVMKEEVITIGEESTLQEALDTMKEHRFKKLPVLSKDGKVTGIIYQSVIAEAIRITFIRPQSSLSHPVKEVLGNLGFVLQFAGVLLLVPAIVATILEDTTIATGIYLTTVLLLVTGFFLNSYGEKTSLNLQQASILVFASLFLLSLFGTVPYLYVFPSDDSNVVKFGNAFFSSAAGFTTGGISLFENPEELPQSFTFYRSYTQLVGGMSFIYLVITAFYPESKLQSMRGFISGTTLHLRELFLTITVIFAVYIVIVALLLFALGERDLLDDFSLAMSTLATGGFVPTSTILDGLLWQESLVLMGAMILGALPFTFHYAFVKKKFLQPKLGTEVLTYFAILCSAILLFVVVSGTDLMEGMFHVVSASTTAGLQLESLSVLSGGAQSILIILMIIGGCGFSTAGGLKIFRLFHIKVAIKAIRQHGWKGMDKQARNDVISSGIILALFLIFSAVTGAHLAAIEDVSYKDAFLEAVGVITTGGLSAGVIDSDTDPATKIYLGFLMIFGRLEIIAIIYIFVPRLT